MLNLPSIANLHIPFITILIHTFFSLRDCAVVPILGFDCEWVNLDGKVQPVALIQIASHSGRCTLVRLSSMSSIPDSLKVHTILNHMRTCNICHFFKGFNG